MDPDGARTPEELETLLEDAFLLRDSAALVRLFAPGAVLTSAAGRRVAQGNAEILRTVTSIWAGGGTYVADAGRVVQARQTALLLGGAAIHVAHRGEDRSWRYVISLLGDRGP